MKAIKVFIVFSAIALFTFSSFAGGWVVRRDSSCEYTPEVIFQKINEYRREKGLNELKWNEKLANSSYKKAEDMVLKDYWSHISPDGKTPWDFILEEQYVYSMAAENLARGFYNNSCDLMNAWKNSPTHNDVLLKMFVKDGAVSYMYPYTVFHTGLMKNDYVGLVKP